MSNLSKTLKTGTGEVAKYKEEIIETNEEGIDVTKEVENPMTVGVCIEQALMQTDGEADPSVVLKRYHLHEAVRGKKEYKFTPAEKKLVSGLIVRRFPPFFAGQILETL